MKKLALVFFTLFLASGARAMDTDKFRYISMGSQDAPITIVEYTSLTCHHCADFHLYVLPLIKQKYVTTGKLRWIIMAYPMDKDAIMAFQLVHSLPESKREEAMSKMFSSQKHWIGKTPEVAGKMLGLSPEQSQQAVQNKDIETALLAGSYHAQKELDVNATPTFYMDSKKFEGAMTMEEFDKTFPALHEGEDQPAQKQVTTRLN